MNQAIAAAALLVAAGVPALAEGDAAALKACAEARLEAGESPAVCLQEAHAPCMAEDIAAPAVITLCFSQVEKTWSTAIAGELKALREGAPEQAATLAAIETKYDILSARVQCDRMEELSLAMTDETEGVIAAQTARCTATATGLAYLKLIAASRARP